MTENSTVSPNVAKMTAALSLIQAVSTLAYAVLLSTLVLYATQKLKLSIPAATAIMGTFGAFNFGLHLVGGYLGGRFLSWRFLFTIGMVLQIIACLILSVPQLNYLYVGLAFFLVGSGLNVTCINMMVTQLFEPEDKRRETAFLWNYALMNVGFFVGFSMAGHFQLQQNFHTLFLLASAGNVAAIILTLANWKKLSDSNTLLSHLPTREAYRKKQRTGLFLVALMIPTLWWFIKHAIVSNQLVLGAAILMLLILTVFAFQQQTAAARKKMIAYLVFILSAQIFWTIYQLMPMGLTIFAQYNVDRHFMGYEIAPQWIQNINTAVIAIGGPLLGYFLQRWQKQGKSISLSFKFSLALLLVCASLLVLPIGIRHAASNGLVSFQWIFYSYVFQSVGEILIGPIGYAMVGQLAPHRLQGVMMGTWMLGIGVAAVLSNYASVYAIHNTTSTDPLITNAGYAHMFNLLGITAGIIGVLLLISTPLMKKLTQEK